MSDALPPFTTAAPLAARVLTRTQLVPDSGAGEVCELEITWVDAGLQWTPGQSIGVVPPGLNARGRPNVPRLYSLASAWQPGTNRLTLLVRRSLALDPQTGQVHRGLCSSYLCDAQPGDVLRLTGPVGHVLDLPADPKAAWILLATGTGIAPFRGFLQHWQQLEPCARPPVWLVHSARTQAELAWHAEFNHLVERHPQLIYQVLRSREDAPIAGRRPHLDSVLRAHRDRLTEWLGERRAVVYCCGVRGMVQGVEEVLAAALGRSDAGAWLEGQQRLRIEVY